MASATSLEARLRRVAQRKAAARGPVRSYTDLEKHARIAQILAVDICHWRHLRVKELIQLASARASDDLA